MNTGGALAVILVILMSCVGLIMVLYSLLIAFITPALLGRYAQYGTISAALNFREVFKAAFKKPVPYLHGIPGCDRCRDCRWNRRFHSLSSRLRSPWVSVLFMGWHSAHFGSAWPPGISTDKLTANRSKKYYRHSSVHVIERVSLSAKPFFYSWNSSTW